MLAVLAVLFIACEDPTGIGLDLQGKLPIETYYTDTVKLAQTTVWQDSSYTSGTEGVVLGRYDDPVFGNIAAKGFFLVNLPQSSVTANTYKFDAVTDNLVFDSVAVMLKYNSFVYGDTTSTLKLSVSRLVDPVNPLKRYIGTEFLPYEPISLGSKTFGIRDFKNLKGDTARFIRIRLDTDFGKTIWDLANKEQGLDVDKFTTFLKGLAVVPEAESKMCASFILSNATAIFSDLRLYCHEKDKTVSRNIQFPLSRARFSGISVNRSGKPLDKVYTKGKQYAPTGNNNQTFVQAGVGLTTRLEFPGLDRLKNLGKIAINRAEIVVVPDSTTFSDFYPVPPFLQLSETQLTPNLQIYRNNLGQSFVATNAAYNRNTKQYVFNITEYLQSRLLGKKLSNSFIINAPTNDNLSRVVLNAKNTKIKINYTLSKN